MINLIKAKEYFKQYASKYDMEHSRIKLKMVHMYHVAENAKNIAKSLNLSEEEQDLAELIGLLHDIGRFEQWKLYHTFSDKLSIDHGVKGVEILFADQEIRNFVEDDSYDSVIFKAINNHNKFEIEKGLSEYEMLHCKIIRDADNLDIFRVCEECPPEDYTHFGSKDVSKEILSNAFFEDFKKEKPLLYANAKNDMDIMVAIIAHIYAISFTGSLKIVKANDYIHKFIQRINAQDEYTRERLNEIEDYTMNYIERKIKEEKI